MESMEWEFKCERCGIGCSHEYCSDCYNLGYDKIEE